MTEPEAKRPLGRPPMPFDQGTADYICDRIASESVSMKTICSEEGLPSDVTVWKWIARYPEFASQYARAKEAQQHVIMDETNDIADDGRNDYMKRLNFDGAESGWHINGEAVARSRMRIENRRWIAAHLAPKVYSDKLSIDQTVGVTDALGSLMERIASEGKRLSSGITVSSSAVSRSTGEQDFASEGEDDVEMWAKQRQRILNDLVKETGLTPDQISPANVEDRLRTEIMAKRSQP